MTSSGSQTSVTTIDAASIEGARDRIHGMVVKTPCSESIPLSELTGSRVFCKLEYLQRTGSFKERGAANALAQLKDGAGSGGVIAASAGNHALALAYHGQRLGVPVTVVMPQTAPLIKAETCGRLGATVIHHGQSFAEARSHADDLAERDHLTYIDGFDHPHVICGQGTLGLEICEQIESLDAVVVPIGGAGLIAGMAVAIKSRYPRVRVIGVEPIRMASYTAAMEAGAPVQVAARPTLADGLSVGQVGANAFAASRGLVDRVVRVRENELALAVLRLMELTKAVVEGAGAAPLAALLSGQLGELSGKRVALPLCGGNIDPLILHRVIEYGMGCDGRLHRLRVQISDRPGGLAALTTLLAESQASVKDLSHDRIFAGPDVARAAVRLLVETRDHEHFTAICQALSKQGFNPHWSSYTNWPNACVSLAG